LPYSFGVGECKLRAIRSRIVGGIDEGLEYIVLKGDSNPAGIQAKRHPAAGLNPIGESG
jgi:hypothetical protein